MRLCLVIAANGELRDRARKAAREMGLMCVEANDGQYAYVASQALMPDFFIIDLDDNPKDGQEFIGNLRRLERGDRPIIICCMSREDKEIAEKALQAGADAFVLKPLDMKVVARQYFDEWAVKELIG